MQKKCKVGFIDSGIGGLNVLNACSKKIKGVDFLYWGDNKNTPYGNKDFTFLKKRVDYILKTFKNLGVDCVVIACNTLSVFLGDYIVKNSNLNVVLTLPELPKNFKNPTIIATPITSNSKYIKSLFKNVLPLPFLAKEIEDNIFNFKLINIKDDLKGLPNKTDSIVLGCTHYLYLKSEIEKLTNLPIISNVDSVADNLYSLLINKGCIKKFNNTQKNTFTFMGESAFYNQKVYNSFFA